jgi:hypothetical protein
VASSAVIGQALGRAVSYAAGLGGETVVRTPAEVLSALGPLGGPFMMDLRLFNFAVTQILGWATAAPSLLYELHYGSLSGNG